MTKDIFDPNVRDPRQTGRTTRIAQFAVDQLLSVGEVIVADHIVYQFPKLSQQMATENLIRKIKRMLPEATYLPFKIRATPLMVWDKWMVHLKIEYHDER